MNRRTIFFAIFAIAVSLGCVRLGFWQISRLRERQARNAMILGRLEQPPVPVRALAGDSTDRFRRAMVSGRYDFGNELLYALRPRDGSPGVNILTPLVIGGRSMGGRVASMLAADGFVCDGLLMFAYPLHPAGDPERLRSAHLARISAPTLCFNGTRDSLCRRDLMEAAVSPLAPRWTMHWLEGADHGFHLPRSAGRSEAEVLTEIEQATRRWLDGLPQG